jgi:hypothetical protein
MAEIEFRDGRRTVPDHVANMMSGLETHRFTYEEATRLAEKKILRDRLNEMQGNIVTRHFRDNR